MEIDGTIAKQEHMSNKLFYGLIFVLFMEYLRLGNFFPLFDRIKGPTVVPILVFFLAVFASRKNATTGEILKSENTVLLALILVHIFLSGLFSDLNSGFNQIFISCTGYFLLYYIFQKSVLTLQQLKTVFIVLIACHVYFIFTNLEIITQPHIRSYIQGQPFLGDGNDFALSLCIMVPFCYFLIGSASDLKYRIFYSAVLVLLVLAVIGTSSRGGSLGMFAIVMYLGLKSKYKVRFGAIVMLMVCIVFIYAPPVYFARLQHINNMQEASAQGRIFAWKAAGEMARDYPLFGVGPGRFPYKYGSEYPDEYNRGMVKAAHSIVFQALGDLGYPGVVFLIVFLGVNFVKNERLTREKKDREDPHWASRRRLFIALNGSLVAFFASGFFLSVFYYPHLYILASIYTAARRIEAGYT